MKKTLTLFALALTAAPAFAADLLQVYRDAIEYDAQYASARAARDAGLEKLPQGRAGLLPVISATASTTKNDVDFQRRTAGAPSVDAQYNTNGYQLTLTQPLFRWQNFVQYDQSKLQVTLAEAQFVQARQDLILRVSQAYFDVLLAQDSLNLAQAQKKAIAEQLESAKRNFEVGTSTIVDTHEAQARFDLVTAQELAAQNDLEIKRQALNQVIGKVPERLNALRPQVQLQRPQPDDIAKWAESAETGSPLVAVQQAAYEIAEKEIGRQRAGHYPTLDLVATRGRSSATGGLALGVPAPGSDTHTTTVGLQLSVPLFAGGAVMSKEREAVALREKARADLDTTRRSAVLGARQAYLGVTSGMAQVKAFEQALVSNQSALDSNKLGYEVGVRINIDVLNAQQQLFSTRRDLAKARYDTLLAQLKLKAAAGTLGEDDVQAINALLEK
ncbi:MAG: TolC family outer membrane protein [Rhodocyclaceae bacterium]|nr:TolC family outer membrane protein [Rhodocyclaceae bacterium]MCP5296177.1 TolC family outer membrane protein [Zoogloeaceae bacterium]MBX3675670.1 TolC family outer membrane protein [Rhodocyclaceae bacterium]MCB1892458.1 TolC family outer membrane protein [Rhodocyclaceae bacterium]MCO5096895.1 TolC family outer membrane protein [Rhodocyclaceae bacterium]